MLPRISAALVQFIQPIRVGEAEPPRPQDKDPDPSFQRFVPKENTGKKKDDSQDPSTHHDNHNTQCHLDPSSDLPPPLEPPQLTPTPGERKSELTDTNSSLNFLQVLLALKKSQINTLGRLGRKVYGRVSKEGKRSSRIRKGTILDDAA